MTDTTVPEFDTVQDILDEANAAKYHSILQLWRDVLAAARTERFKPVTPQWANRIVSNYQEITFADMIAFRTTYFNKVISLLEILESEIDSDDECLNVTSAEEDVEQNSTHYLNVLFDWQKAFLMWELEWVCTDSLAAVELGAISEVHRMFFGQEGLTALLDQIQFTITDDDRDLLANELRELQDVYAGPSEEE